MYWRILYFQTKMRSNIRYKIVLSLPICASEIYIEAGKYPSSSERCFHKSFLKSMRFLDWEHYKVVAGKDKLLFPEFRYFIWQNTGLFQNCIMTKYGGREGSPITGTSLLEVKKSLRSSGHLSPRSFTNHINHRPSALQYSLPSRHQPKV